MVTIIVPIYNREKYLKRCIDSIIAQTYCDIEIILVDDGSTDNSGRICDEYAIKDSRIIVIHQQNVGSSLSRIKGIEMAHGDYIQFVDCDDWIEPYMVESMMNKAQAEDVEVVWCNYVMHTPEPVVFKTPFDSSAFVMLNATYRFRISGCLWNKLYRADLLQELEASRTDFREDVFYTTQILSKNPSMSFVPLPLYHYDQIPSDSLTKKNDFEIACIPNYEQCYNYLVSRNCITPFKNALSYRSLISKIYLLNKGRYKEAQSLLTFANLNICNYPVTFPFSVIYWIAINCGVIGKTLFVFYKRLQRKRCSE